MTLMRTTKDDKFVVGTWGVGHAHPGSEWADDLYRELVVGE